MSEIERLRALKAACANWEKAFSVVLGDGSTVDDADRAVIACDNLRAALRACEGPAEPKCSSLCAPGEPCSITEDGQCDAKKEVSR